jgi:soluble lytic murein transglycosylase-like protein
LIEPFGRIHLMPLTDVQENSLSRQPDRAGDQTGTVPSEHLTELEVEEPSASEDNRTTTAVLGNETAVPISLNRVCEAIRDAAIESGIPVGFFARLLWQESNFRSGEISTAGARGIAQFMPQTALEVGLNDPFDPLQAIPASAKFIRKLHNQFGNLGLAAAAYNAGGGRIEKWLSRRGPLPQETRAYVKIITGNKAEDWATESKIVSLPTDLPRGAP